MHMYSNVSFSELSSGILTKQKNECMDAHGSIYDGKGTV